MQFVKSRLSSKWEVRILNTPRTRIVVFGGSAFVVLSALVFFSAHASRPNNELKTQRGPQQDAIRTLQELHARFPTVDYDSSEPTDLPEREKRKHRNKHYDGRGLVSEKPYASTSSVIEDSEAFYNLPALPAEQSDVILTADVLTSRAHLSNDKNGIYSEFNIHVDQVLKGTITTSSKNDSVSVSRLGGIVCYPSGQKVRYEVGNQNMPATQKRYVFFLKATDDPDSYEILTGYEMRPTTVLALDRGAKFEKFNGTDVVVFLNAVRDAISK